MDLENYLDKLGDGWIGFCQYRKFWSLNEYKNEEINFNNLSSKAIKEIPKEFDNYETILGTPFFVNKSNFLIPEYSILIKYKPIKPMINGKKKLIKSGKKTVKLKLKNEFKDTSRILKKNKKIPVYKYVCKLSLSGFKKLIFIIIFL